MWGGWWMVGWGGAGAAELTFYVCCSCRISPPCWRPFDPFPLNSDEALPQPSLKERDADAAWWAKGKREGVEKHVRELMRERQKGWVKEWKQWVKREGQSEAKKKKLMLLSHSCKEPPGVCIPGRAYCCCHEKTFCHKLQLKDYFKCSEEILQLLGTHHIFG